MEEMNKLLAKRWVFGRPQLCGHQEAPVPQHRRRDRLGQGLVPWTRPCRRLWCFPSSWGEAKARAKGALSVLNPSRSV